MAKCKDISGRRFGRLVATQRTGKDRWGKAIWLCMCDCGGKAESRISDLTSGNTQSCGCQRKETLIQKFRKNIEGKRFGKLLAVRRVRTTDNGHGSWWQCKCDCGKKHLVQLSNLTGGYVKSCGNCGMFVNGIPISVPQQKVSEMVQGLLNHPFAGKYIDVALPSQNIAIEYDGWYWHKNRLKEDEQRKQELIDSGWHVLTIKASTKVPTQNELLTCLSLLEYTNDVELIMSDWRK